MSGEMARSSAAWGLCVQGENGWFYWMIDEPNSHEQLKSLLEVVGEWEHALQHDGASKGEGWFNVGQTFYKMRATTDSSGRVVKVDSVETGDPTRPGAVWPLVVQPTDDQWTQWDIHGLLIDKKPYPLSYQYGDPIGAAAIEMVNAYKNQPGAFYNEPWEQWKRVGSASILKFTVTPTGKNSKKTTLEFNHDGTSYGAIDAIVRVGWDPVPRPAY